MNNLSQISGVVKTKTQNKKDNESNHSYQHLYQVNPNASIELQKNNKHKYSSTRILQFCQQQRLLAEKDLHIQKLLSEGRSIKGEAGHILLELQRQLNQAIQSKVILCQEIECLKRQNGCLKAEIDQKDKIICAFMGKISDSNCEHQTLEKEPKFNNSQFTNQLFQSKYHFISVEQSKERKKKESSHENQSTAQIQVKQYQSSQKIKVANNKISSVTEEFQSANSYTELPIAKFIGKIQEQLGVTAKKEQLASDAMTDIISQIQKIKADKKQLSQQNQRQTKNISQLQKIIEGLTWQSQKVKYINEQLNMSVDELKSQLQISEEVISQLKSELHKTINDKQAKEVQLFNIKMKIHENKNNFSMSLRNVSSQIKDPEDLQNEQSKLRHSICTEGNCNFSKYIENEKLNKKVGKLEKSLEKRQKHIQFLESALMKQKQRAKKIFQMATEFDSWFNELGQEKMMHWPTVPSPKFRKIQSSEAVKELIWKDKNTISKESIR